MRRRDVRYWHLADNSAAPPFVRYWSNSGQVRVVILSVNYQGRIGSAATAPHISRHLQTSSKFEKTVNLSRCLLRMSACGVPLDKSPSLVTHPNL